MPAGLNLQISILRETDLGDDVVGGANSTGVVLWALLPATITANMPSQRSLDQGLEVPRSYTLSTLASRTGVAVDLRENDEITVTFPLTHPWNGWFFSVEGVHQAKRRNYKAHLHATLRRTRFSRRASW
jgi:hypothetical protein